MITEIKSEKKNVQEFLQEGQKNKFLIPDYQREYSWTDAQVTTLFEDLIEYMDLNRTKIDEEKVDNPYFLGCIVYYKNDDNKLEIIDGQQRITTLFLLLRALYDKISGDTSKSALAQKENIANLLWKLKGIDKTRDYDEILLESKVATDKGKETLISILKNGAFDGIDEDDSRYANNYLLIKELIKDEFEDRVTSLPTFIYTILTYVIVIPIIANSIDSAMQIFTTLNDRGLSLSDADIFKSEIYKHTEEENRNDFIDSWNSMNEKVNKIETEKVTLDRVFYYYMMYNRAKNDDVDTTTPKLRDYFIKYNKEILFNKELIKNLNIIIDFLQKIDFNNKKYSDNCFNNFEIEKLLNVLSRYPNEWWKYPCIVYYLSHKEESNFNLNFKSYLSALLETLTLKYLEEPSISKIKPIVLKINQNAIKNKVILEIKIDDKNKVINNIITPSKKIAPMLLSMLAYNDKEQKKLLPTKLQKEHILPRKWKYVYKPDNLSPTEINAYIDHIGNYLPLEYKINAKASNDWLKIKRGKYRESEISFVLNFEKLCGDTWNIEKIKKRDVEILDIFKNEILN